MPATMLKNKVMYRQFIHSVSFVNYKCCTCLRPLYLYFLDMPRTLCPQHAFTYFICISEITATFDHNQYRVFAARYEGGF